LIEILLALFPAQPDFSHLYREAYRQRAAINHPKTAESAADLGLYLASRGNYAEAGPLLPHVLSSSAPDAGVLHNWAVHLEEINAGMAEQLYRRALGIRGKALAATDPELATTRLNLANLILQSHTAEAETLARASLVAFVKSLGPMHARTGAATGTLAAALAIKGDVAGAERYFRRALAIVEKAHGPKSPETAAARENLADLLDQTGRAGRIR
jgi:tetratricopeptide (TPR) repeat protein